MMNDNPDQSGAEPLFSRPYKTDEIPAKGVNGSVEASENERAAITAAFDLEGLENFRMDFQLSRSGRRNFTLMGHLTASPVQTCVISLAPLKTIIDERFEIEFWPREDVARIETEAGSDGMSVPLEGPEPIVDGVIDVGQLAYEHLAASLDSYPKEAGAKIGWRDPKAKEDDGSADKPFAALAKLKQQAHSQSD